MASYTGRIAPSQFLFPENDFKMSASAPYAPNAPHLDFDHAPSWTGPPIHVGVIGGSGLYKLEGLDVITEVNPMTVSAKKAL